MARPSMNMDDLTRNRNAIAADKELRRTGGSPSCSYKRLSVEAVGQLKRKAHDYTAAEWADQEAAGGVDRQHKAGAIEDRRRRWPATACRGRL